MPFQTSVGYRGASGIVGDFVTTNPRWFVPAGPGGLIAGAAGVTIGRFGWLDASFIDQDNAAQRVNNFGAGPVGGLVCRNQAEPIVTYLADSTQTILPGHNVQLMNGGDMFVKNEGSSYAKPGMKAYANLLTGAVSFAVTGSPTTASGSASSVAASTFSVTGSISGNVLTVTAVGSGTIYPGATISGTSVATGTQVLKQLSGTTGGVGTYAVDIAEQAVASTTISGTYGTLTVGGTVAGTFGVGGLLSGTNVAAGTYITAPISGTGGAGTYVVNNNTVVSSTAITATVTIETKFFAVSGGAAGETIKIDSHSLG